MLGIRDGAPFGQDHQRWLERALFDHLVHIGASGLGRQHHQILGIERAHIPDDLRIAPGRLCQLHNPAKAGRRIRQRVRPAIAARAQIGRIGPEHEHPEEQGDPRRHDDANRAHGEPARGRPCSADRDVAHPRHVRGNAKSA